MALAGVDIHAPLIQENRAAAFFQVRVRPGRGRCRLRPSAQGQDASLLPLQDYGYYAAGVEAKKAYLRLMHFFRTQEGVPTLLLAPPPAWQLEIVGKIYETSSFDCRSSQLALLLGMLACQGHLPVAEVFASGELNNTGDLPRVEAVGGLAEKFNAILEHIELSQPRHPVLIALPRRFAPGKGAVTGNDSAERFARRLQTFRQANPHLSLTVMYCDDLAADLAALFPRCRVYRHWNRRLLGGMALAALLAATAWQFQQPLYLNWGASSSALNRPLRVQRLADGTLQSRPLCADSTPGEPVFAWGDEMVLPVHVQDASWLSAVFPPQVALVMVGEESGVRVENLEPAATGRHYQQIYRLEPPAERYVVMAVARRALPLDKGALNRALDRHLAGMHGIARIAAAAGYLEKRYNSVRFRFRLVAHCKDE